ncbi:hypothetical protein AAHC03_0148 [Spirometra sp. Aus1]
MSEEDASSAPKVQAQVAENNDKSGRVSASESLSRTTTINDEKELLNVSFLSKENSFAQADKLGLESEALNMGALEEFYEANDLKCHIKDPSKTTKIKLGSRKLMLTEKESVDVYVFKNEREYEDGEPDLLSIFLTNKSGIKVNRVIEINWMSKERHKPFLGGYKSKLDERVFHNASAQTLPKPIRKPPVPMFSRETQTYKMKHATQETLHDSSTAMTKVGFYYSNATDKLVVPMQYETADKYAERVLGQVIVIQRYVRRWLAQRRVARLRRQRDLYDQWVAEQEVVEKEERDGRFGRDYEHRLHPRRRADFDRLFNALEQWRKEEASKIYATTKNLAERKAALALLLDREVELITSISRHQIEISKKGRLRAQEHMLEKAAAAKRWTAAHDGKPIERDTPETLRARELLIIYQGLKSDCLSENERMDLLLSVKKIVQEYPSKLCCELIFLIERETEMIVRRVPACQLSGLRARIVQRFVQFCKKPEYNPGIADYLPLPNLKYLPESRAKMWANTFCCKSCGRYLRLEEFPSVARANSLGPCYFCRRQSNRGRERIYLEPYRLILEELRRKEARLLLDGIEMEKERREQAELERLDHEEDLDATTTGTVYKKGSTEVPSSDSTQTPVTDSKVDPPTKKLELLVTVEDVYFLVNDVWDNKSALSGCSQLADLVLCRWHVADPWAPWNTFLVTRKEAELHYDLESLGLENVYAEAMIRRVRQRLVIARYAFSRLCPAGERLAQECKKIRVSARTPVDTNEWRMAQRHPLPAVGPPLYITTPEDRHKPTLQPPRALLPIIRGEKRFHNYGLKGFKELPPW